jgi:hypothetical protein
VFDIVKLAFEIYFVIHVKVYTFARLLERGDAGLILLASHQGTKSRHHVKVGTHHRGDFLLTFTLQDPRSEI